MKYGSSAKDNLGGILADSEWKDNGDGTFSRNNVTLKIGDYVNYTYDTADAYALTKAHSGYTKDQTINQTKGVQWRVLGINENGKLELISAKPIDAELSLGDAAGYNNGVYLLNDICKSHYSNKKLKIEARSLTINDLEKQYSEAAIKAKKEYNKGTGIQYGHTKSYDNESYPVLYAEEAKSGVNGIIRDGGIDENDPYYKNKENLSLAYDEFGNKLTAMKEARGNLVATQTYYYLSNKENTCFKNQTFNDMIFGMEVYWLASRCVDCRSTDICFGLRFVRRDELYGVLIAYSGGGAVLSRHYLRPVVTLDSYTNVIGSGENIGTANNMWQLS